MLLMRSGGSALLAAALLVWAAPATAQKPARACIEAHADGQVARDADRLLQARELFGACAAETCPSMIRKECADLRASLLPRVPSIVIVAQDATGKPLAGGQATIDGSLRATVGNGSPLELDPGSHRIEVVLPDGRRQVVEVSLAAGELARRVVASFVVPVREPESSGNELAYVLGGVGLLALGTWGAFAYDGHSRQADLEQCAPRCTDSSKVNAMRRSYLVADVLLSVSAVTLGASAYLLITNVTEDDENAGRTVLVGARGRF